MAKIVVSEFLTLDGVIQAPGDPNEDRSGGFDQGGWQLAYFDEGYGRLVLERFAAADGLLLGRRTYENFGRWWPNAPAEDPVGQFMNAFRKYVVSTTLTEPLSWTNSTLIKDDVPGAVSKLRAQPGKDIQVQGSGELVQTLIKHNLVDEYRLMIHPLVLGAGKHLFGEETPRAALKLVDSTSTGTGVSFLTYVPA